MGRSQELFNETLFRVYDCRSQVSRRNRKRQPNLFIHWPKRTYVKTVSNLGYTFKRFLAHIEIPHDASNGIAGDHSLDLLKDSRSKPKI